MIANRELYSARSKPRKLSININSCRYITLNCDIPRLHSLFHLNTFDTKFGSLFLRPHRHRFRCWRRFQGSARNDFALCEWWYRRRFERLSGILQGWQGWQFFDFLLKRPNALDLAAFYSSIGTFGMLWGA